MSFDPSQLPGDVIDSIFRYITLREISRIQFTSKSWYAVAIRGRHYLVFQNFPSLSNEHCAALFPRINPKSLSELTFHSCYRIEQSTLHFLVDFPNLCKLSITMCFGFLKFPVELPFLPHLTTLQLKYSGTPSACSLGLLTNLEHLKIHNSNSSTTPSYTFDFSKLPNLRSVSTNSSNFINSSLAHLTQLSYLHLCASLSFDISKLQSITRLKLQRDVALPLTPLQSLPYLTDLTLTPESNPIPTSELSSLTQLHRLKLGTMRQHMSGGGSCVLSISATAPCTNEANSEIFLGEASDRLLSPLAPLIHLKDLSLSLPLNLPPPEIASFYSSLSLLPLSSITFSLVTVDHTNNPSFSDFFSSLTTGPSPFTLRSLRIPGGHLSLEQFTLIQSFQNLTHLEISSIKIPLPMATFLSHFPLLKNLNISGYQGQYTLPLPILKHLVVLNLSETDTNDQTLEGIEHLSLTHLVLSVTKITNQTVSKLSKMISLVELHLNKCDNITPTALKYLRGLYNLTNLYLNGMDLTEEEITSYLPPEVQAEARRSSKMPIDMTPKKAPTNIQQKTTSPPPLQNNKNETCLVS